MSFKLEGSILIVTKQVEEEVNVDNLLQVRQNCQNTIDKLQAEIEAIDVQINAAKNLGYAEPVVVEVAESIKGKE